MSTVKNKFCHFLILFPFIWLFTGLFWFANGDKIMVATIVISIIATIFIYKFDTIKENIHSNKFLWLLLAVTTYGIFSYYYHGYGSREIRALIASSLFILFFPKDLISKKLTSGLLFVASFGALSIVIWQSEILGLHRSKWFINAIPYATFCSVITVIALSFLLTAKNIQARAFFAIPFILSLIAVLYTQTRGIWLALLFAVIGILILHVKHTRLCKKSTLSLLIAIIAIGYVSSPQLKARYNQTLWEIRQIENGNLNTSIGLRFQMWQAASVMIKESPLFGVGDNQINQLKALHQKGQVSDALLKFKPPHYHSQLLDKLVKTGMIGLLLYLLVFFYPLYLSLSASNDTYKYFTISIIIIYFIASLTDVPLNNGPTALLFFLTVNIFSSLSNNEHNEHNELVGSLK